MSDTHVTLPSSAEISPDRRYRFRLERRWAEGAPALWIMLNPSMADARRDDPTIRRVTHFSKAWGYPAVVVVNLFPYRSPSPEVCRAWRARGAADCVEASVQNDNAILAELTQAGLVVAAWGSGRWYQDAAERMHAIIEGSQYIQNVLYPKERGIRCLGKNADGSPKHPLARGLNRVTDDQQPEPWVP